MQKLTNQVEILSVYNVIFTRNI